jgi:uncharacterized protein (DUF433 family)
MNATDVLERVPIHTDADGVVRVARTRVTLDTIVGAFESGATAEEIAQQYSSVPLVDVYSVITYYLRHKPEVDTYLKKREDEPGASARKSNGDSRPRGFGNDCWPAAKAFLRCFVSRRTRTSTATSCVGFFAAGPTSISSGFKMSACRVPMMLLS